MVFEIEIGKQVTRLLRLKKGIEPISSNTILICNISVENTTYEIVYNNV